MPALVSASRPLILAGAIISAWLHPAPAQDRVAELHAQFNRENDPVRKAKLLPKLGDAQFERVRKDMDAGNYAQALRTIEDYRDEVRSTQAALKARGVDAERKPAGFKQLQIHVRKSVREIEQVVMAAPDSEREPFDAVRRDLLNIEKELLELLFPRQPAKSPAQEKPKG